MNIFEKSRRPAEKVHAFLEAYAESDQGAERLPDADSIANQLGVSRGTVRNVLNAWRLQGKLTSRRGKGVYLVSAQRREVRERVTIVSNLRSVISGQAPWGERIRLDIMDAISAQGPDYRFASLYSAEEEINALSDEEVARRCEEVDGFILYQRDPHLPKLYEICRQRRIPYVVINQPDEECSTNFVTTGNFRAFLRMGEVFRECGRRRFALLIYPSAALSTPIRQRLAGVACGIGDHLGNGVELQSVVCEGWQEEHGYRATKALLASGQELPDLFLCAGDWLALGTLTALEEAGIAVPERVSVVAGAGMAPALAQRGISTLLHPLDAMGRELVELLMAMIRKKETLTAGRTLPVGFRAGATTTEEESARLSEAFQV